MAGKEGMAGSSGVTAGTLLSVPAPRRPPESPPCHYFCVYLCSPDALGDCLGTRLLCWCHKGKEGSTSSEGGARVSCLAIPCGFLAGLSCSSQPLDKPVSHMSIAGQIIDCMEGHPLRQRIVVSGPDGSEPVRIVSMNALSLKVRTYVWRLLGLWWRRGVQRPARSCGPMKERRFAGAGIQV